ncbi:DUF6397 family protein [Streptomyces sp. NPDC059168]|uniref:DUF6397 family protein n=1 Tax=Streptomyces sp. NPDC059168 TaxID=3346753 RepID=UPI00367EAE8D
MPDRTLVPAVPATCSPSRAARELGLRRAEFDLAVHLGRIRTVPDEGGGTGRGVERAEIERLRARYGFPSSLREHVRVVGTAQGAALMRIAEGRFTRLARLGLLVPVRFHLNRYRAVVWLYLAEELEQFATGAENARLLKGRTPETLRAQLATGVDLRARNWRGRHFGFLLRQTGGPWPRAAAVAAFLAPAEVADVVRDPRERAVLERLRPAPPAHGAPGSSFAHLAEHLMTSQDSDEIGWLRSELAQATREARAQSPAARPPAPLPEPAERAPAERDGSGRPVPGMSGGAARGGPARELRAAARAAIAAPPDPAALRRARAAGREASRPTRGLRAWLHRANSGSAPRTPRYRVRNRPSCTTETSSRPRTS